ncbi:MAG: DUF4112 domain-containing protein [Verrucomicrobiota bacterium]|nr:DUF4112 domain-containing protein [Verrucomicrobiota bacterium]
MALELKSGGHKSPLQEPDWEVLPPEEKQKRSQLEPLFRWLALIMDDLLRVPGTRLRFGLDPIIGLLPGFGDTAAAIISAFALLQAARRGLPKIVLARMSLNILINELVGIIPGVGDAFSFWFKSNARNYQILQAHMAEPRRVRRSDWIFVVAVLVLLFLIVCGGLIVSFLVLQQIVQLLSGR